VADRTIVLAQNKRHAVRGVTVVNPQEFSAYQEDDDDLTYIVDMSSYLDGATISSVTRTPTGVTVSNTSNTTTRLTQRLKGFGYVDINVTSSSGEVEQFRITIQPRGNSAFFLSSTGSVPQNTAQMWDVVADVTAANIDNGISWIRTQGYYTVGDGGGALYKRVYASPSPAGYITSNSGTTYWELVSNGIFNVRQFGAKGDNTTNDTTACQLAVTAATSASIDLGGVVYFPVGQYRLSGSGLTIDQSGISTDDGGAERIVIRGDGSGSTHLHFSGSGAACINYTGGSGGGLHSYFTVSGIRIDASRTTGQHGISLTNAAYFALEDLVIFETDIAVRTTDCLSGQINRCSLVFNNKGAQMSFATVSRPNNITFLDCEIGNNYGYGIYVVQGALVRVIGGAVEGNGSDTGASIRGGIRVEDCGVEGGVGLYCTGVYFEANQGPADIFVDQTTATRCHHYIAGNSLSRVSATDYVTNNIRFDCSSGTALTATVHGNAFKSFNGYTPSAARLCVDTANCAGTSWLVHLTGNSFESATDTPASSANLVYLHAGNIGSGSPVTITETSDVTANSTGTGTIKFKGATNRDSAGFVKIFVGSTEYYVPVFTAITG